MTLPLAAATRRPCSGLLLAPFLLCLWMPSAAAGASRSTPVERARQFIEEAEFDRALKVITEGLGAPDNSDDLLVQLYELQGTAYLYQGKEDKARQSFERLLQASPEHELAKGTSSKIRSLFEQVRADERSRKLKPVKISHERLASATAGERLDVHAEISDLPQTAKARLYYRRAGTENYSSTSFAQESGTDFVAKVPSFELPVEDSDWALEYYLEVDASGRRLAGVGDALAPLSLRVRSSSEEPAGPAPAVASEDHWYNKWWVWTIVGVVAVGAGAGATAAILSANNDAQVPVTIKVQQ